MNWPHVQLCVCFIFFALSTTLQARELVLVSNSEKNIESFNKTELRRLFLGFKVTRNNTAVTALRNSSSSDIYQVFLQNVMFMSERNYERRLLSLIFTKGNNQVTAYTDIPSLTSEVSTHKNTVSYLWLKEVEKHSNLKIIQVLWSDK